MITESEQIDGRYSVMSPGMWENDDGPADWFAVLDEHDTAGGIVAYAMTEDMAVSIANHLASTAKVHRFDAAHNPPPRS